MDHVAGSLHILLAGKEGRIWFSIIWFEFYQFERIIWWCLSVLESILKCVLEFALQSVLKFFMLEKTIKQVTVSQKEVGLTKILRDHETLSIGRHVGFDVDFSSM